MFDLGVSGEWGGLQPVAVGVALARYRVGSGSNEAWPSGVIACPGAPGQCPIRVAVCAAAPRGLEVLGAAAQTAMRMGMALSRHGRHDLLDAEWTFLVRLGRLRFWI